MKSGSNCLVFGGTGLIGTALINRLKARGHTVVNVSTTESCGADDNVIMSLGVDTSIQSLSEIEDKFPPFDEVFHLASHSTATEMNKIQLGVEHDVLESIIQTFDCRISYASSYAVYDESKFPKGDVKNNYRQAKRDTEIVIREYQNDNEFNVRGFRIPAVYGGEDNTRALYRIKERLEKDEAIVLDKTNVIFCYVVDVVDGLLSDNKGIEGMVDIDAVEVPMLEMVTALKNKLNSNSRIEIELTVDEQTLMDTILF